MESHTCTVYEGMFSSLRGNSRLFSIMWGRSNSSCMTFKGTQAWYSIFLNFFDLNQILEFRKLFYAHAEHTQKRFYRMLSILGTDFIAHLAYEERISAHAQPAVKCELFTCTIWAYAERILSHTEHTRNEFHRMLSILGTDFIACWACAEMFKSRISLPIRAWFLKISCYRPLGPYDFGFCKKSKKKKMSCLCTFNLFFLIYIPSVQCTFPSSFSWHIQRGNHWRFKARNAGVK
jgi:hypothetical protein